MSAIDNQSTLANHGGTTIYIGSRQSPIARTLFFDTGSAWMRIGLVVVVDNATEGLIGIGTTNNPFSCTSLLHFETSKEGAGITRKATKIIGRIGLGTMHGSITLELEYSILDARAIADGKLTGASVAGALDNETACEVVPVAFDIFAHIVDIPGERSQA